MPDIDRAKQREFAVRITKTLRDAGYESLWAGGCVRDQLLGRQPKDYDVATNATPDQIRELFGKRHTLPIGAAFGVVCVVGPTGAGQIEVATFRKDSDYSDGRHPDEVSFSTAEEDARRRDFTVNGLFFDPLDERVIDYVGGQQDIQQRVLRAIGDAESRISEDKLRMLRAIRLSAALDFQLDDPTFQAVKKMARELTVVSAERITAELRRMLTNRHRVRALTLLSESDLAQMVFPDVVDLAAEDKWQAALEILEQLRSPSFPLALAALLCVVTDAAGAAVVCREWKMSNDESDRTVWLVGHHAALDGARSAAWPRLQRILIHAGSDELLQLFAAKAACGLAAATDVEFCRERLSWPAERLNPPPLVTGDDLRDHGIPPGKVYSDLLTAVRDAQLKGEITTRQQALDLVDRLLGEMGR